MKGDEKLAMSRSISLAFPTLIGRFKVEDCGSLNDSLKERVLSVEAMEPSQQYANMGGWHSKGDLLDWEGESFVRLKQLIVESLKSLVQATGQLPETQGQSAPRGRFGLTAWANVSRLHNYHRMHNHPNSAWSGVYYVTAPESEVPMDGVLELYDPRSFAEMIDSPGSPYGQRIHVKPEPGLMVVFPSWLYHFVHPCKSESVRISIAFNARWQAE